MRVGFQKGSLYLGFGSIIQKIDPPDFQKAYLDCLNSFIKPRSLQDIKDVLLKLGHPQKTVDIVIKNVLFWNYVIDENTFDESGRYSRNHLYFSFLGADPKLVQEKLFGSHVAILGCGGIGNAVGFCLATSGVGKLTLIDDDIIEFSNLTRQFLFTNSDVGEKKVKILKRELLERSKGCSIRQSMLEQVKKSFKRLPPSIL